MIPRVLSEEEINAIELALIPSKDRRDAGYSFEDSYTVVNHKTAIHNLIVTIRDRDKTVAEFSARASTDSEVIDELIQRHNRLVEQNTLMLSTLESMYDHPAHSYYEFTTYAIQTIRDAIAKVKCIPVSEGV